VEQDVARLAAGAYKVKMPIATESPPQSPGSGRDLEVDRVNYVFDLLRGVAAYTGSPLVGALAKAVNAHPAAALDIAFNHKQIACKIWARDKLLQHLGGTFDTVWVLGGWYGVMAAILFDDPRYAIGHIQSIDFDKNVLAVAATLNAEALAAGRFSAVPADMYALDYHRAERRPDLVINTSCEHIPDLQGWLALLPEGMPVLLQSNNYATEPSHVNIVRSSRQFAEAAGLSRLVFAGELQLRNYTRFMLIGAR
jgi:hypothetical protein